ncbi:MAG: TonB-dependent receptor [Bacteroidota bacterium]
MKKPRTIAFFLMPIFFALAFPVRAQSSCKLTFACSDCNLVNVLDAIAVDCGVKLSYDAARCRSIRLTEVQIEQQPWSAALREILAEHPFKIQEIGTNRFALVPVKAAPNPPTAQMRQLRGQVLDGETGEPLPGAAVVATYGPAGPTVGVLADEEGKFTLEIAAQTTPLKLNGRFLGYVAPPVVIGSGKSGPVRLLLRPKALELESVIVTGRSDQLVSRGEDGEMLAVSPRQVSAISVLGEQDVFRTLQFLPGVSGTEESANGLYIRGSTPDQNLVLIDGVPIYNTGHFFGMFHAFNAEALGKVDISRGGFGVARGGAAAGLIDIESRPRPGDSLSGSLTANLAATSAHLTLPFLQHKAAVMVAGRRSYSDIVQSPLYRKISGNVFQTGSIFEDASNVQDTDSTGYELDPISNFHDVHAKVVIGQGAKGQLSANFYNGRDIVRYSFATPEESTDFQRTSEESLSLANNAGGIHYHRQLRPNLELDASAYLTSYRGFFFNDQFISEQDDSLGRDTIDYQSEQRNAVTTGAFRGNFRWQIRPEHNLEFGIQARRTQTVFEISATEQDEVDRVDSVSLAANIYSLWAGYTWNRDEKLQISPGVRINYYGMEDEISLEPRLQASWKLPKGWRVNGNIGRYEQFLNPVQVNNSLKLGTDFLALASADNGISSTVSYQGGLGVSWMRPGIWVDVQAYYKRLLGLERYTREFDANTNATEFGELLSDGDGDVVGLDVLVRGHRGPWTGWMAYTIGQVRHLFPLLNFGDPFPADNDHRHELKVVNMVNVKRWEFSLTWIFASGKPYSVPSSLDSISGSNGETFLELEFESLNTARLPSYHRLDANVAYVFPIRNWAQGRVGVSFFNIYDRQNIRDRNYTVQYADEDEDPLEIVAVDRELLGFSPNVFLRIRF